MSTEWGFYNFKTLWIYYFGTGPDYSWNNRVMDHDGNIDFEKLKKIMYTPYVYGYQESNYNGMNEEMEDWEKNAKGFICLFEKKGKTVTTVDIILKGE